MKKLFALIALLFLSTPAYAEYGGCAFGDCPSGGGGSISDAAYSADWNGDTTAGASKNALYDKIETIVAGGLDFALDSSTSGNIVYVGCSDDIQTAITAASAGDTLMLGSCTYTVGTQITVGKALKIVGQGSGNTIITSGATALTSIFTTTADGLQIKGVSFRGTDLQYVIIIDLAGGTSTSGNNNVFDDIDIDTSKATDVNSGIELLDTGAVVKNSVIKTSTGDYVASQSYGIQCDVASTADVAMELIVINTVIEDISTDVGGNTNNIVRGIRFYDVVSGNPNQMDLYLYNVSIKVRDDGGNALEALHVQGDEMTAYVYNSMLDGYGNRTLEVNNKAKDIRCDDGAVCYLSNTVLASTFIQESGGTINRLGTLSGQSIVLDQAPTMRNSGSDGVAANDFIYGIGGQGSQALGTGSRTGGEGADIILTTGMGGKAINATTTGTGGGAGDIVFTGADGQVQDAATAATNVGGTGGQIQLVGGTGGVGDVGVTASTGGGGGWIALAAGDGGAGTNAGTTNTGGAGGDVWISSGNGGAGASAAGADGNVFLGVDQAGNMDGYVVIGSPQVITKLTVSNGFFGGNNDITIHKEGTGINNGNSLGGIDWFAEDTQLTTQNIFGRIRMLASADITSDAATANMVFYTTLDSTGPIERLKISSSGSVIINDASTDGTVPLRVEGNSNANVIYVDGATDSVQIKSSTATAGPFIVAMPASEAIAGGATITANACGTIKRISSTGNQTTSTTDTFTAPAAANTGCCMDVINVDTADTITLDQNTNFLSNGGINVALGPNDTARVCSNGTSWFQVGATGNN